jgi:hypothetical protein
MNEDQEHLRLLSVFHYVVAGLMGLFSLIPVLHLVIGIAMITGAIGDSGGDPGATLFGWFFALFAGTFILMGLSTAACVALTGRFLAQRRHYTFCFVMECVGCMFVPFGTVLGVLGLIVLLRPSVKELFGVTAASEGKPDPEGLSG